MSNNVSIREFGHLHRDSNAKKSLDNASLTPKDWDDLLDKSLRAESTLEREGSLFDLRSKNGKHVLQAKNFVGFFALKSGTTIEILPKLAQQDDSEEKARSLFMEMLKVVYDLPFREFSEANVEAFKRPLPEVLISRFLETVQRLINIGLRSDYMRVSSEEMYVKGKIRVRAAMMQLPHQKIYVPIEYEDYRLDRPENRLLRWSVEKTYGWASSVANRMHARKLLSLLSDIPKSVDPAADLKSWRDDRNMRHYRLIKPWIELLVQNLAPWTQRGAHSSIALFFPMERLFEEYVYRKLKGSVKKGYRIDFQPRKTYYLADRGKKRASELIPDIVIKSGNDTHCVLDTKWKILDENPSVSKSDMYQIFAYAKKCRPKNNVVCLVYPMIEGGFCESLDPPFDFGQDQKLFVVPFNIQEGRLELGQKLDFLN